MQTGHYTIVETAIGACGLAWMGERITRFRLPEHDRAVTERRLQSRTGADAPSEPSPAIARTISKLQRYFEGERIAFDEAEIALPRVSEFFERVYAEARALPWGETATYGEIARRAGVADGAQAVGQAMGSNPLPIIIPCHRVLAAGAKLGGFSAYGGVVTKQKLLAMEGVHFDGGQPSLPGL
ncbi:methylated-DNA--protein-cysteine methyltransferase [Variibacter gotjawalensis]|uniref:methylated-DNA--[protein]-cysteine S-methyltransferase n=1 Tax=Variibacter gotjawalensis TaxID=1333996 RepID=A0A0S3PY99_9BRAD|nr:methylated-DNA--[protein]-cysteine S-methyltransferase [Variibacter gotjawalensis]NIK46753.1 methylated-DNA-[protein]-cysteine S-methyltransferase [Variibacter gotjawalensis]RZS48657.1 methylated-DNA-[protein]-cysteine S-methyltransferase [Variibacter gotjawalensis]BAT60917.1 methylated-DNA--protein-cysteine methyltransferase [Variibacter gotjawalensis]